jgi:hypothetical protein
VREDVDNDGQGTAPSSDAAATQSGPAEIVASADADRAAGEREAVLAQTEKALLSKLDDTINGMQRARLGDEAREHLEILRGLLKAQVSAYLGHFTARRATLFTQTSTMYASAVGAPGVLSTTLHGLMEGRTITGGQAAKVAQLIADRRTLLIFGDRATGKSTLLNALFELVSLDERFVAVERGPDLPALKERSFCLRLTVSDDTDLPALFTKARRMQPDRLVIGEMHAAEVPLFFDMLAADPRIGGFATLRADTVNKTLEMIIAGLGSQVQAEASRRLLATLHPVFLHMHSDEKGVPRLAGLWEITGLAEDGELELSEIQTIVERSHELVAEA